MDALITSIHRFKSFLVLTHVSPDGDGLGSQLALHRALKVLGKKSHALLFEPYPRKFQFLDPAQDLQVISKPEQIPTTDRILVTDTHEWDRLDAILKSPEIHLPKDRFSFLDHHTPDEKGAALAGAHCIRPEFGSTGELAYALIEHLGVPLTLDIALPLYVAIVTDTNAFRFSRTSALSHQIAAKLLDAGVEPERVFRELYAQDSEQKIRYLGNCLQNFSQNATGSIAWLSLAHDSRAKFGADIEDTESFLDRLMLLQALRIGMLFREEPGECIKISFRSHAGIPVLPLAREFAGGGHLYAAGTRIQGKLSDVIARVTARADAYLKARPEKGTST